MGGNRGGVIKEHIRRTHGQGQGGWDQGLGGGGMGQGGGVEGKRRQLYLNNNKI